MRQEPSPRPLKRLASVTLLAVCVVAGLLMMSRLGAFALVDARLYDLISTAAPPAVATPERPSDIVIVAIDEPSFSEIGAQWPWPRDLHARLIQSLRAAGAKAIALDIVFAEPSANFKADAALAAAVGPDTVLAADESLIETPQMRQLVRTEPAAFLLAGGGQSGVASVALDPDGVVRHLPLYPDGFARQALAVAGIAASPPAEGEMLRAYGPARSFPTVSYYQALEPDRFLPPETFRGKIVIVGLSVQTAMASAGGQDIFATPFTVRSKQLLPGAEIHATIADNLARGLTVRALGDAPALGILLVTGLLAALAAMRPSDLYTGAGAALLLVLLAAAAILLLYESNLWLPPTAPALAIAGIMLPVAAFDFRQERRMRRTVTRAFSQYLAPAMVERLVADAGALKLGGERRELTILFSDVRGFTTIAETMKDDPQKLTALINRLLNPMSAIILAHGGTIDKYMGDCVMAFWNAPLDDPDHALHALSAGIEMLKAIETLNAELQAENGPDMPKLAVGVGINTGDCAVGNMGSDFRFDYTAIGDAVNLASRLEGLSKTYGVSIVLGEETARRVADSVPVVELDRIAVRGRVGETPIFRLAAQTPSSPAAAAAKTASLSSPG